MYKNRKPLIIGILCTLIVFMAVGFALLSQELTITGTSSINSNWNIRITNIRVKNLTSAYDTGSNASADVSGTTGCTTKTAPCDATSANFEAKLITPGDSITYEVTITNSGNLDGVVESINLTCSENEAITCTTSGLSRADTISHTSPNNTNTVDVTVTYNSATSSQPVSTTSDITLTINYQQDLGQVVAPRAYSIEDQITYKDTAWRVIKNSTVDEDYVTLMKETVLTSTELGDYAYTFQCTGYAPWSNCYSQEPETKITPQTVFSKNNSNDYTTSDVKAAVEAYMTDNDMTNDLKEVDGYKIRLVTYDELMNNLGYEYQESSPTGWYNTENTPSWVYSGFGEDQPFENSYWTMTSKADSTSDVFHVVPNGVLSFTDVSSSVCVRPVINLLKTAIPPQS